MSAQPFTVLGGGDPVGLHLSHAAAEGCLARRPRSKRCEHQIRFFMLDPPDEARGVYDVVSEDPLTLTPNIVCPCGAWNGFIQDGKWVPA